MVELVQLTLRGKGFKLFAEPMVRGSDSELRCVLSTTGNQSEDTRDFVAAARRQVNFPVSDHGVYFSVHKGHLSLDNIVEELSGIAEQLFTPEVTDAEFTVQFKSAKRTILWNMPHRLLRYNNQKGINDLVVMTTLPGFSMFDFTEKQGKVVSIAAQLTGSYPGVDYMLVCLCTLLDD